MWCLCGYYSKMAPGTVKKAILTSQAWKMKFLNFMPFQVFHDLYEPCLVVISI